MADSRSMASLTQKFTPIPPEDLNSDPLLQDLPRTDVDGREVPVLGKIPLLARLGKGAMGAVYYGVHPRLKIEVAVKVLHANLAKSDPALIERFYREAQSAARVSSRHLVHVTDVDEEYGLFYIMMEYVRGISAVQYLKLQMKSGKKGVDEAEALDIVMAATRGLAAAHVEGIIHRDVKPANIMVPQSKAGEGYDLELSKLADLGLARPEGQDAGLTGAYQAIGTPGFMAPEQIQDASTAGKAADVFSMGATLHALLTATTPFPGASQMIVLSNTMTQPHLPVETVRRDVSLGTVTLIDRCLSKEPSRRYSDGQALLDALRLGRQMLVEEGAKPPKKSIDQTTVIPKSQRKRGNTRISPISEPNADTQTATKLRKDIPKEEAPNPAASSSQQVTAVTLQRPAIADLKGAIPGCPPPPPAARAAYTLWPFDLNEARRRRKEIAQKLNLPTEVSIPLNDSAPIQLTLIPPGEFLMGSPQTEEFREKDEFPHYARMTRPYYISVTPVTQEQWQSVTGLNAFKFKDLPDSAKRPAERISWLDVQEKFLPKILPFASEGWKIRLPSEAEWEYAARAGTETPFHFGLSLSLDKLNCKEDRTSGNDWKWVYIGGTSGAKERLQTSPVCSFPPNAWGLSDVHGNVWEWCEDFYSEPFYHHEPCVNPVNTSLGEERVLRGGGWNYTARYCRSAARYHSTADARNVSFGFRVVCVPV
jgi:formylglycine-generating enzyme required for sulfatase activity